MKQQPEMAAEYSEDIYVVANIGSQVGKNEERDDVKGFEREENEAEIAVIKRKSMVWDKEKKELRNVQKVRKIRTLRRKNGVY